jgi:hypothetical protein
MEEKTLGGVSVKALMRRELWTIITKGRATESPRFIGEGKNWVVKK